MFVNGVRSSCATSPNGAVERQVRELYTASTAPRKRLVIDDSGDHGTTLLRRSAHRAELEADILDLIGSSFPR